MLLFKIYLFDCFLSLPFRPKEAGSRTIFGAAVCLFFQGIILLMVAVIT